MPHPEGRPTTAVGLSTGGQWQAPAVQVWPVWQRLSQAPQLLASVMVFAHPVPQRVMPAAQVAWQVLFTQRSPTGQTMPQAPQLFGSTSMLAQTPPQGTTAAVPPQLATQAPATHTSPGMHTLPQEPQVVTVSWRSTQ